jgi:hypothetical protein
MTAGAIVLLLVALGQHPTTPPAWPGSIDGCKFGDARGAEPRVPGRPSDMAGLRRVYVWSSSGSDARQNIVNVLRRDLPQLVIVRTFDEAEMILGFLVLSPSAGIRGVERTGGWGVGCASRKTDLSGVVGVLAFDGRWEASESVIGATFAEQFVNAYRRANGVAK